MLGVEEDVKWVCVCVCFLPRSDSLCMVRWCGRMRSWWKKKMELKLKSIRTAGYLGRYMYPGSKRGMWHVNSTHPDR